jgi:hypothetical protein
MLGIEGGGDFEQLMANFSQKDRILDNRTAKKMQSGQLFC